MHQKEDDSRWTEEMNDQLMKHIDSGGNGKIEKAEFTNHYADLFEAQDASHFDTWFEQFSNVVNRLHEQNRANAQGKETNKSNDLGVAINQLKVAVRNSITNLMATFN